MTIDNDRWDMGAEEQREQNEHIAKRRYGIAKRRYGIPYAILKEMEMGLCDERGNYNDPEDEIEHEEKHDTANEL